MPTAYRTSVTGGNTTGTTDRTLAISALAGDLLVVCVSVSATGGVLNAITDDAGGTYTIISRTRVSTTTTIGVIAIRNTMVAANATITVTVDTNTNDSEQIGILAYTGMFRTGSDAVRSWGHADGNVGTPACTLTRTPLGLSGSGGPMIAILASDDTTTSPPPVMTERIDASQITPTIALEVATRDTYAAGDADAGLPGSTVTFGAAVSGVSGDWVAIAIELDASDVKIYAKAAEKRFLNGGPLTYVPSPNVRAVKITVVASGAGGGAATTVAGAAGGGGSSGEWLVAWYTSPANIAGGAVTVPAGGASASNGANASVVINGVTFTAVGGTAGATSTAVSTYGEADPPALGTAGSQNFDIDRGANPSANAMISATTGGITAFTAGLGGGTPFGRGGRGNSGDADGSPGTGFGAGGGGGRRGAATNRNGGVGAPAVVIIEEYVEMPTAAEIADAVWNTTRAGHAVSGSFGENVIADVAKWKTVVPNNLFSGYVQSLGPVVHSGTATAGAAGTITLAVGASATTNLYAHSVIVILSGTGAGQARRINSYVGGTRVATLSQTWTTNPDATSVYVILPSHAAYVDLMANSTITAAILATGAITNVKFAAGAIDAASLATGAITSGKFAAGAIDAASLAQNTKDLFGEVRRNTATAGAASTITLDAGASTTVSQYNGCLIYIVGGTGAGQGARRIRAYTAGRVASVAPPWTIIPDVTSVFEMIADTGAIEDTGILTTSFNGAVITNAILDTGCITSGKFASGAIDSAAIGTDAITSTQLATSAVTEIQTGLALSADVTAVKAKTDQLTFTVTNRVDATASLGTDSISAAALSQGAADKIRDSLLNYALRTGRTVRGHWRRMDSLFFGKVAGLIGSLVTGYQPDGVTTEISAVQNTALGTREAATVTNSETP